MASSRTSPERGSDVEQGDGTIVRKPVWRQTRRTVTGKTQKEALDRLDDLRRALEAGPGLPAEVTTGRFLEHWITAVLPSSRVQTTTADNYARALRLYVIPTIGKVRLDHLAPAHVRTMLAKLREQKLSPNTQRLARSVLRRALRTAIDDGLIVRNAAAIVDGVRVGRPEGRTLTPEQARTLLAAIETHPARALVTVLLSCGLRKGEALGLAWSDLDLEATPATLTVRRALKKDGVGGVFLDEPKTAGSKRTVHLPSPVADVLRRHRVEQNAARLEFGEGWGTAWPGLVFTSSIGTPLDPDRVNRTVQKLTMNAAAEYDAEGAILEGTGLGRWTPHELRHSAASLLLAQGVPLKVVSETLGHSSIRVTADVYGHLMEPAKTEAADAMEAALWG